MRTVDLHRFISVCTACIFVFVASTRTASARKRPPKREGAYLRFGFGVGVGQDYAFAGPLPLPGVAAAGGAGLHVAPEFAFEIALDVLAGFDVTDGDNRAITQGGLTFGARHFMDRRQRGLFGFGGFGVALGGVGESYDRTGASFTGGVGWEEDPGRSGSIGFLAQYSPRILSDPDGFAHSLIAVAYMRFDVTD